MNTKELIAAEIAKVVPELEQENIQNLLEGLSLISVFISHAKGFIQQMIFTISLIMTSMKCHWRTRCV